jgi:hypothetical protein
MYAYVGRQVSGLCTHNLVEENSQCFEAQITSLVRREKKIIILETFYRSLDSQNDSSKWSFQSFKAVLLQYANIVRCVSNGEEGSRGLFQADQRSNEKGRRTNL